VQALLLGAVIYAFYANVVAPIREYRAGQAQAAERSQSQTGEKRPPNDGQVDAAAADIAGADAGKQADAEESDKPEEPKTVPCMDLAVFIARVRLPSLTVLPRPTVR
jgi:hypothetical protein